MMLSSPAEIRVLRQLCNKPFTCFSINEISRLAGISNVWAYRVAKKIKRLLDKGRGIKLDYSMLVCKRLKLLFDAEYLEMLDKELKGKVFKIAEKVIFEMTPRSVVLVGSAASGNHNEKSDIDFLVICEKKDAPYFENYNLVSLTEDEFKDKYIKGDDFAVSSLLSGRVLLDNNFFMNFLESPLPFFSKDAIQEKIKFCEALEERIYALLRINDKKSEEELLYLALQSARIILLKNKIVPGAKNEIAGQVRKFNRELSEAIQKLQKGGITKKDALSYIRICMDNVR